MNEHYDELTSKLLEKLEKAKTEELRKEIRRIRKQEVQEERRIQDRRKGETKNE